MSFNRFKRAKFERVSMIIIINSTTQILVRFDSKVTSVRFDDDEDGSPREKKIESRIELHQKSVTHRRKKNMDPNRNERRTLWFECKIESNLDQN